MRQKQQNSKQKEKKEGATGATDVISATDATGATGATGATEGQKTCGFIGSQMPFDGATGHATHQSLSCSDKWPGHHRQEPT